MTIIDLIVSLSEIGNKYSYDLPVYSRLGNGTSMIFSPDHAVFQKGDDGFATDRVLLTNGRYIKEDEHEKE